MTEAVQNDTDSSVSDVPSLTDEPVTDISLTDEEVTETTADNEAGVDEGTEADEAESDKEAGDDEADEKIEYEDFNFPEGIDVDQVELGEFKELAADLGLDQEGAQRLIDFEAERVKKAQDVFAEAQNTLMEDTQKRWKKEVKADKEIGGANLEKNIGVAKIALNKFGTPELKEFLSNTGAEAQPEILRFLFRVGQTVTEDQLDAGNPPSQKRDVLDDWYGSSEK